MLSRESIKQANAKVVAAARPSRVILFGSYARGEASEDSDPDLLVVEPTVENKAQEMVRLRRATGGIGAGVDVLVNSEEEVARRGQVPGTIIYRALKEGEVLYDAHA